MFGQLHTLYNSLSASYNTRTPVLLSRDMPLLYAYLLDIFPEGVPGAYNDPHDLFSALLTRAEGAVGAEHPFCQAFKCRVRRTVHRTHFIGDKAALQQALSAFRTNVHHGSHSSTSMRGRMLRIRR